MTQLRVHDLKQWFYCPRIVFYHYIMPVETRPTWKMQQGHTVQQCLERLEKRRGFGRYGLEEARRHFNVWLTSQRLGLSGQLDLLLESPAGLFPVDFKFSTREPYRNHLLQLAGYALLVEERWERPVEAGFIYLTPAHRVIRFELEAELKQEALARLDEIRRFLEQQRTPPPTSLRRRCDDCEFRNCCADIF